MKNSYVEVWNELHKDFISKNEMKYDDWLEEFKEIISNVDTEIIDLGCGVTGNNTLYLIEKGKKVLSCDFAEEALKSVSKIKGSKTLLFDMLNEFPFNNEIADLIIADLSLHYFKREDTERIIKEIKRILKPNGILLFRVNSINSTEYKKLIEMNVEEIEHHLFFNKNMEKRFFSKDDLKEFFKEWKFICLREENMSRWCSDKIIWKGAVKK